MRHSRTRCALVLILATVMLAACGGTPQPTAQPTASAKNEAAKTPAAPAAKPFAGQTLVVSTWGGDWKDVEYRTKGKPLEELTGAKVEYFTGNPQDARAKIIAAKGSPPPIDVISLEDTTALQMGQAGQIEPIDYAKLSNAADLIEKAKTKYAVAFLGLELGFAYNGDKFKELGLTAPTNVKDLLNAKLAGRVTMPTLDTMMGPYGMIALAKDFGGDERNIKPGFDALKTMKVNYYYKASADLVSKMTAGEVWAAFWQNSRGHRLAETFKPAKYETVRVGDKVGMLAYDLYGVTTGTKQRELAYMYINIGVSQAVQEEWARWGIQMPTNVKAQQAVLKDAALAQKMPLTKEKQDRMYNVDLDVVVRDFDKWLDMWNAAVAK